MQEGPRELPGRLRAAAASVSGAIGYAHNQTRFQVPRADPIDHIPITCQQMLFQGIEGLSQAALTHFERAWRSLATSTAIAYGSRNDVNASKWPGGGRGIATSVLPPF